MRRLALAPLLLALACQPAPQEMQGIYLSEHNEGVFFPCDNGGSILRVQDSTLAIRYRTLGDTSRAGVFVRLRAAERDSGSVYDSRHYLIVDSIVEIRARRGGDCPGVVEGSEVLEER
jgi:hypothetical protein